jgi:hypothetical protein
VIGDIPGKPTWIELMTEAAEAAQTVHKSWSSPEATELRKRRSSLIRLAHSSMRLYEAGLEKGLTWEGGRSPLLMATTALKTVRNQEYSYET